MTKEKKKKRNFKQWTHIHYCSAGPLLPREVHQLVVGALEEADRALAEVRGDVELVPPLVDHFHFPGLEGQQRLFATPHNNRKIQTTKTKNVPPPKKKKHAQRRYWGASGRDHEHREDIKTYPLPDST